MSEGMRSIPTTYRNVKFRSRLEAKWAAFFDRLGVIWEYEPDGYLTSAGPYLPDFLLPWVWARNGTQGVFLEVKPEYPSKEEQDKAEALCLGSGRTVLVVTESPLPKQWGVPQWEEFIEFRPMDGPDGDRFAGWDNPLHLARCSSCGQVGVFFHKNDRPCPCGRDHFEFTDRTLEQARLDFPNLVRWEAAA